jgi:diguanylate cyclase (GGDEF)-like protein
VCGGEAERDELEALRVRIRQLEQDNSDLEIALTTAVEHGDAIENDLAAINDRLRGEVAERVRAETRLEQLLSALSQQKDDLEILLSTITEHSDSIDADWLRRYTRVEALSATDGLTGIANRRAFDDKLAQEWRRSVRNGTPLALLMLDVDYFKNFNDRYGHQAGDECLSQVAQVLQNACRRPVDMPARYGGEDFALILPETELAGAAGVAEMIRQELARRALRHEDSPYGVVTVSIGVLSRTATRDSDAAAMLADVDALLYSAKREGRNMFRTPLG